MKSVAIVTMSDSNFFELLTELIDSINNFNQRKDVAVCVLDAGLSEDQIKFLSQKAKVDLIKKANWDIEVPSYKVRGKEWLKSQVSRAFLPDYFPGFKKYFNALARTYIFMVVELPINISFLLAFII